MPANEAYPRALEPRARRFSWMTPRRKPTIRWLLSRSIGTGMRPWRTVSSGARSTQPKLRPGTPLAGQFSDGIYRLPEASPEIETARKLDPDRTRSWQTKDCCCSYGPRRRVPYGPQADCGPGAELCQQPCLPGDSLDRRNIRRIWPKPAKRPRSHKRANGWPSCGRRKRLRRGRPPGMLEGILGVERRLYVKGQLPAYALAHPRTLGRKAETLAYLRTSLQRMEPEMVSVRTDRPRLCAGRSGLQGNRAPIRPGSPPLIQEISPVQRVALLGDKAGVADQAAQFFFVARWCAPAAETTFSSIMMLPTSLPPKRRPSWQVFSPGVTQED